MSYDETLSTPLEGNAENLSDCVEIGIKNLKHRAQKLGEEMDAQFEQSKDDAEDSLEAVSENIDTIAHYIKAKNANNMLWDISQVIRKNPFKTLAVVGILGLFFCKSNK